MRTEVGTLEEQVLAEVARINSENQKKQGQITQMMNGQRGELDTHRTRLTATQQQHQNELLANIEEVEKKLRSELSRVKAGGSTTSLSDLEVSLKLEDAEGREWSFNSVTDFLEELARRVKDLHLAINGEIASRIDHERRMEIHLAQEEQRRIALQDVVTENKMHEEAEIAQIEAAERASIMQTMALKEQVAHL